MVDALASGASVRKGVGVQIPPRAQMSKGSDSFFVGALAHLYVKPRIWEEPERSGGDGSPLAHSTESPGPEPQGSGPSSCAGKPGSAGRRVAATTPAGPLEQFPKTRK